MTRILSALWATIVLVLLVLSPASASPYFDSELICLEEFADTGHVMIKKPSGDLYVLLRTGGPPIFNEPFSCEITCDNDPPNARIVLGFKENCGNTGRTGTDTVIVSGLGQVGPGKAALFCRAPVVRVSNDTIDCTSGYPTPQ